MTLTNLSRNGQAGSARFLAREDNDVSIILEGTHIRLEPLGPNRTRFTFDERYHLTSIPFKWFEGPIYRFINKNNEDSMRRASAYLSAHPEYRPDLVDA